MLKAKIMAWSFCWWQRMGASSASDIVLQFWYFLAIIYRQSKMEVDIAEKHFKSDHRRQVLGKEQRYCSAERCIW